MQIKADDIPSMNEFLVRGVPLSLAVDARARWRSLTDDEKLALGFESTRDASSSTKLPVKSYRGSLH